MASYSFVARDSNGQIHRGIRDGVTLNETVGELRAQGWIVVQVQELDAKSFNSNKNFSLPLWKIFRPRSIDVEISLQQLAFMLRSGLPLLQALRTCANQCERQSMTRVWLDVSDRIQEGGGFSEALAQHKCFPRLVVTMVAVGEQTGLLDQVLLRAASAMERRRSLLTSLKTALTYPTIVITMAIGLVAYMMLGLIPKLKTVLAASGKKLPGITQLMVDMSNGVQTHYIQTILALLLVFMALLAFYLWPPGRMWIDRSVLRLPVFGKLLRVAATATFARTLETLVASGVRLTEALRVSEPLHRNSYIASRVAAARERVFQGSTLAEPLAAGGAFLPMLGGMVAVGEASGTLDEVLREVANFHELRLEAMIRRLSALVEPVTIIIVGGIVGFVYLSFFMAIYSVIGGR